MLKGRRIALRARAPEDVPILHAELYEDVAGHARADGRAWRPHPVSVSSPMAPAEPTAQAADFSVVLLENDELLGNAVLWRIDPHNRSAHIGLDLLPAQRGKGYGTEVVEVLCGYAFRFLGLHRVQIETLADNGAMSAAAMKCGFRLEGTLRGHAWVEGSFVDQVVYGLLADEWGAVSAGG